MLNDNKYHWVLNIHSKVFYDKCFIRRNIFAPKTQYYIAQSWTGSEIRFDLNWFWSHWTTMMVGRYSQQTVWTPTNVNRASAATPTMDGGVQQSLVKLISGTTNGHQSRWRDSSEGKRQGVKKKKNTLHPDTALSCVRKRQHVAHSLHRPTG